MEFKQGNKGLVLTVVAKRLNQSIINITGKTPKLQIKNRETGLTYEEVGTVTDGPAGTCTFVLDTLLTNPVGVYDAEVELDQSTTYAEDSLTFPFTITSPVKA